MDGKTTDDVGGGEGDDDWPHVPKRTTCSVIENGELP